MKHEFLLIWQVSAEDGEVCGEYVILDDFIHLSHANGVYLLDDRLCILAVRLIHSTLFSPSIGTQKSEGT